MWVFLHWFAKTNIFKFLFQKRLREYTHTELFVLTVGLHRVFNTLADTAVTLTVLRSKQGCSQSSRMQLNSAFTATSVLGLFLKRDVYTEVAFLSLHATANLIVIRTIIIYCDPLYSQIPPFFKGFVHRDNEQRLFL